VFRLDDDKPLCRLDTPATGDNVTTNGQYAYLPSSATIESSAFFAKKKRIRRDADASRKVTTSVRSQM